MLAEPAVVHSARTKTANDPSLAWIDVVTDLALLRIAAEGGATRGDVVRDLAPMTTQRLSPSEQRSVTDAALVRITVSRLADEARGRFKLTQSGQERIATLVGRRALPKDWAQIRDVRLVALALGLTGDAAARIKALEKPEALRAAVLARAYGVAVGRNGRVSAPRLRTAMAAVALGRAFGDQVTSEIGNEGGLSARAGRLLAGQLLARPRDLGTDSRLISALAAEAVGAVQTDATALRAAVLRGYVMERVEPGSSRVVVVEAKVGRGRGAGRAGRQGRGGADVPSAMPGEASAAPTVASGLERADVGAVAPVAGSAQATGVDGGSAQPGQASRLGVAAPTPSPNYAARPDLAGFALAVRRAAEVHAEGWPGNRKAFVCDVWEQIKATYPSWGLTNVEFKAMLTEAHRTGHLALANADLANKSRAREIQASAIAYKNTVWHLVRVEDPG